MNPVRDKKLRISAEVRKASRISNGVKKFPNGFLWGAGTSAYQVEGGIENNDWAQAGRERLPVPPYIDTSGYRVVPAGAACNHYNRFEEDFDIAKTLNHNAHRFSVEWARIEPEEGKFDEKEIEHYRQVVKALRARGMEPFVTILHFTLPLWFSESGGWGRSDAPTLYARYALKVVEAFGDEVTFFLTLNEPWLWFGEHALVLGARKEFLKDPARNIKMFMSFTAAHSRAYRLIKKYHPKTQIGLAHHVFAFEGKTFFEKLIAAFMGWANNRLLLNFIRKEQDFIGLQYYLPIFIGMPKEEEEQLPHSDIGWVIYPEGIYDRLMDLKRYNVPIYITENGISDGKDQWRTQFIKDSLSAVHRAIEDGALIKGYLHWSLLDNYEWWRGYGMRFGLVEIDYKNNQKRTIRESARTYAEIIKNNGIVDA